MAFVGPLDPDIPPGAVDLRGTVRVTDRRRDPDRILRHVFHRAGGPDWPARTEALIASLLPHWPGQVCPYWAFVEPDGRVVVAARLEVSGAHALPNSTQLGTAVVGDFRKHAPPPAQWQACLRLAQWVCDRFEAGAPFHVGHSELPHGSKHPSKVCPGELFDVAQLRAELQAGGGS